MFYICLLVFPVLVSFGLSRYVFVESCFSPTDGYNEYFGTQWFDNRLITFIMFVLAFALIFIYMRGNPILMKKVS